MLWQGSVESLRLALGGSVAQAGALNRCPFQGDATGYNSGQPRPRPLPHPRGPEDPAQSQPGDWSRALAARG